MKTFPDISILITNSVNKNVVTTFGLGRIEHEKRIDKNMQKKSENDRSRMGVEVDKLTDVKV